MRKKIFSLLIMTCLVVVMIAAIAKVLTLALNTNVKANDVYSSISKENVCVALNYHRVRDFSIWDKAIEKFTDNKELTTYSIYKDEFCSQMDYLIKSGAYFATPEELAEFRKEGIFPDKCVLISFDDVDISVYNNAFPILKERKIPFTLFIIGGQVGNKDFNNFEMASWDQLREMKDSGLASFGSHTYNMHYLEDGKAQFLDENMLDKFEKDIKKSREIIQKELGIEITCLAYPFGDDSDRVAKCVKDAGFKDAFILSPHPIDSHSDPYSQCRYLIDRVNFKNIIIQWLE